MNRSEMTMAAVSSAITPLVELVALAAQNGWEIAATADGDLEWIRDGNRIVAKFSKSHPTPAPLRAGQLHRLRADRNTAGWHRRVARGGKRR